VSGLRERLLERIAWVDGHADVWRTFWDAEFFPQLVAALADPLRARGLDRVAGIEGRGFILGAPVAVELGAGFVAIRKDAGLFPGHKLTRVTPPDYRGNTTTLRLQAGSVTPGDRVALVDDWFETGSQALTARALLGQAGAVFVGASVIVDQLADDVREAIGGVSALIPAAALGDGGS